MIFRVPVGARYFEVVVCENIERHCLFNLGSDLGGEGDWCAMLKYTSSDFLEKCINNGYTIEFMRIIVQDNHIWTNFRGEKKRKAYLGVSIVNFSLLTKITFIDKAISNKNIAELIDMYGEYMKTHRLRFLSNDMYRILFNLKNDWTPYGNVIRNFEFFSENMRRKVSNEDEFKRVIVNSFVNISSSKYCCDYNNIDYVNDFSDDVYDISYHYNKKWLNPLELRSQWRPFHHANKMIKKGILVVAPPYHPAYKMIKN